MTKIVARAPVSRYSGCRAFTLTEVAIVLGIIGLILGGIWAAAGSVYSNNRTREANTEVLTLVANWKSIYGVKRIDIADGNDMSQMTVNNGFAPPEMIPPAGTTATGCAAGGTATSCNFFGPWSGSLVNVISKANDGAIGIFYSNLTATECNNLGNALANSSGLVAVTIGGQSKILLPPLGAGTFTISTVSGQCVAAGQTNSILAEFSLN